MAQSTSSTSNADHFWLPPPASTSALPEIRHSLSSFPTPRLRVSRVAQLDANLLDTELESILGAPVWKALDALKSPGRRSYEPEAMALMRLAILRMSLYEKGATYGSMLQNLKYRNEFRHKEGFQSTAVDSSLLPIQRGTYMALQILPSYLHARLRDRMLSSFWSDEPLPRSWFSLLNLSRFSSKRGNEAERENFINEWKRVTYECLNLGEKLVAVAGLLNFLVFLYDGKYRTLIDRVLRMRLIYVQRSITPNVSFEFLNRQLVWEAFTEFLLFLMPLVNVNRLRLRITRLLTATTSTKLLLHALPKPLLSALRLTPAKPKLSPSAKSRDPSVRPQGAFHFLPSTTCPVCYSASNAPPTALPQDPTTHDTDRLHSSLGAGTTGSSTNDISVKLAYTTNCGWNCRYCYYCAVGKLAAAEEDGAGDQAWECLRCGEPVTAIQREVMQPAAARPPHEMKNLAERFELEEETGSNATSEVGSEHQAWRT